MDAYSGIGERGKRVIAKGTGDTESGS